MNKKSNNNFNFKRLLFIAVVAIGAVAVAFSIKTKNDTGKQTTGNTANEQSAVDETTKTTVETTAVKDSDIVIQVKEVTEKPTFYPATIDGINLEVIAVKASDGSIRTAFNTCQVCYSSGKGYYKVEGDELVCQNCGNRFTMDDVEVTKGGCNPVPITSEYKKVDDETITVTKDVLTQATEIFKNWK